MTTDELAAVAAEARTHANSVQQDIGNATTRIEHMRLTRLAIEADQLAARLESMLALYRRVV